MKKEQSPILKKRKNYPSSASIQKEHSVSYSKSKMAHKESTSCAVQEGENDQNILDQQIHIGSISDSLHKDSDQDNNGKLKILSMLDDKRDPTHNKNMTIFSNTKKKSGSKLIINSKEEEELACKKATEDTRNYLREMRRSQILEQRENMYKSKGDIKSEEMPMEDNVLNDNEFVLETKRATACDRLMKKAHRGTQGIGYSRRPEPEKIFNDQESRKSNGYSNKMSFLLKEKFSSQEMHKENPFASCHGNRLNMNHQMNMFPMKNSYNQQDHLKKRPWTQDLSESFHFCEIHQYKKVEFICSDTKCLREMCSMCILDHREHIDSIKHMHTHITEQYEKIKNMDLKKIKSEVNRNEEVHSKRLDCLYEEIKSILHSRMMNLKDDLVSSNNKTRQALINMEEFKRQFAILDRNPRMLEYSNFTSKANTNLIKSCISFPEMNSEFGLNIERSLILKRLRENLGNNLSMISPEMDFNTVEADEPKYLHWFEWGERNLHLYDIIDNKSRTIKLVNNIKIPNFSRSIVTPTAKIFLLGGEDPEGNPKKEIYLFDLNNLDSDHILEPKALMPHQKYDFSLCYLDGYIYVICGKDTSSEAVNICER
jgi:hypothetical protein